MADKNSKLFDTEQIENDTHVFRKGAAIDDAPALIEKKKDTDVRKLKEERLEALRYAETYRQRLRLMREAKKPALTDAEIDRQNQIKSEREKAFNEKLERERDTAREHSDRVRELLARIENKENGQTQDAEEKPVSLSANEVFSENSSASDKQDGFVPLKRKDCNSEGGSESALQDNSDNLIKIDMDIQSDVLHIDGIKLGDVTVGHTVVIDRTEAEHTQGAAISSKAKIRYPDPEINRYPEPEFIAAEDGYKAVEYTVNDSGAYERELITKNARAASTPVLTDPTDDAGELYINTDFDINSTFPEWDNSYAVRKGAPNHIEYDRYTDITTQRGISRGRAYPDLDTSELFISNDFDVNSTYPEAEHEYIAKRGTIKPTEFDRTVDISMLDTSKRLAAYPDPEAPIHNDLAMQIDDTLEEPLSDVPKSKVELTRKERREHARAIKELRREDMLRFERESREKTRFSVTPVEQSDVGEDIPGSIYPDPDYVTDEPVLYGDEYTAVSKRRQRDAMVRFNDFYGEKTDIDGQCIDSTDIPVFNRRALKKLVKKSCAIDVLCVAERYESRLRELRLELQGVELRFDKRKDKNARTAREIQKDIARVEREERRAVKIARKDNERYYAPVLTDYSVAKLKKGADRALLLEKRTQLLDELARRDEINERLISLYTGKENGRRAHFEKRIIVEMKAKRRAYRRQRKLDRAIVKYHISYSFSKRLYALMDEYVELCGNIARIEYSLKKEKLLRSVKRDLKKERRKLKRKLLRVSDHIDYYERRAIEEADDRRDVKLKMIVGWTVLIALIACGILAWAFWEPLSAYIAEAFSGGV